MGPRAVVTGGAGFVGSHLCERLVADGWTVEVVDNLSTGSLSNLASLTEGGRVIVHQADLSDGPVQTASGEGIDAVFHLACPASPVQYRRLQLETLAVSSRGTEHALALAAERGGTFVIASTSEVYGDPLEHPQRETYFGNVDPVGPRSMYDEGKRFAEALATWTAAVHGVDVCIARIFNTYGPRMDLHDGRIVPTFVRQALAGEPLTVHGDGGQTRSFCFVSDLVDGLVRLGTRPREAVGPRPVNLGNPVESTVLEIAERVLELTGSSSRISFVDRPPQDPSRRCPDIARAREVLDGWEPTVALDQGLRATIEWARAMSSVG